MAVAYIGPKNTRQVLGAAPYFWWQELDQTMPLGRWRGIATGGDLVFQENTHATIQFSTTDEWLRFDESADAIVTSKAITLTGGMIVPDDALLRWGTSGYSRQFVLALQYHGGRRHCFVYPVGRD